jgi:hypothetical protein
MTRALRRQTLPYRPNLWRNAPDGRRAPESPVLGQTLPLGRSWLAPRSRPLLAMFVWGVAAGFGVIWLLVEIARVDLCG